MRLPVFVFSLAALLSCRASRAPEVTRPPVPAAAPELRKGESDPLDSHALATMVPPGSAPVDKLIADLEARVGHVPKVDNWVVLGQAWVRKARETADPVYYLNADACADQALRLDPKSTQALELRTLLQLSNHQFARARDTGEAALAKRSDLPLMLGLISDADLELGDYDGAERRAQEMMNLKPCLPSYSRVSYLHWLHGDQKAALESVRLAIDSGDPKEPEAVAWVLVQAAMIFWNQGDVAGADAGFDRALTTFPDFPPALVGKGRVALARDDPKRAAALFDQAFHLSPLMETAWLLTDARTEAGDAAGAAASDAVLAKQGVATDPRTTALYWATHDREHARALEVAAAERQTRDDLYTEDTYAWALYRAGKIPEARAASDKALILNTPDARLLYHAGAIRLAQGQRIEGLALVRKALALNPHFDVTGAREARALVATAR